MEEKPGPSSAERKRKRAAVAEPDSPLDNADSFAHDEEVDDFLSLEKSLTFSDTLVALRMMRAQFPKLDKVSVLPFILRSQLYSSVKDRTQVDRDLETLKRDRTLRIFKLNTGQDDHAVMFLDDYIQQIDCVLKKMKSSKEGGSTVFGWFKTHVIMSKLEPSIAHQELCSLLSAGGKVKDEHISLLINAGILTRQLIDPSMYWFAIPNIGSILKGLSQGRKELLSFLSRRKHKEMMLALLEKKRLRFSPLDVCYLNSSPDYTTFRDILSEIEENNRHAQDAVDWWKSALICKCGDLYACVERVIMPKFFMNRSKHVIRSWKIDDMLTFVRKSSKQNPRKSIIMIRKVKRL